MSDAIIQVDNLGKCYRIAHQQQPRRYMALRDVIAHKVAAPFRALKRRDSSSKALSRNSDAGAASSGKEDFWALKNISFEVKPGEVVGIIGRNGAGKSTLLKILSRITEPSEGRVRLRARVASLLEVGTGFHPELTGRENIFLNGAILGMHAAEIRQKFDEIVAFAEVEKFLDTPVKHFSSGMYVRLAFAVAAHLESEILIVDEVLAVGDAEFQRKCLGKMQDVSTKEGRTVLFVSHNMLMVRRLCSRAILLGSGRITAQGDTSQIIRDYQVVALPQHGRRDWPDLDSAPGSDLCRIRRIRASNEAGMDIGMVDVSARFIVEMVFDVLAGGHLLVPNFHFFNEDGQCLFVAQDLDPAWRAKPRPAGRYCCRVVIPENFLAEGRLTIGGAVTTFAPFFVHGYAQDAIAIVIEDSCNPGGARGDYVGPLPGVVRPLLETSNEYSPFSDTTMLSHA